MWSRIIPRSFWTDIYETMLLRIPSMTRHSSSPPSPPSPPAALFFLKEGRGGLTLPKIPRKRGMEKLLKGREDSVEKWGIFSSWGVANVTNVVTFNYILVTVFLFPMNVGVSPYFHSTVLVPVYRVYTSCLHITVVSSFYRLHTSCLHDAGVTSFFSLNIWF